jgi:hypothetical protein
MVADGPAGKVEDRVSQAASTSRDELASVGQTLQEQGRDVAQQAKEQAQSALHRMAGDVRSQAESQASNLSQSMHEAGGQMRAMADAGDPSSFATTLVREGADAAERLASRLDSGGVDGALAEVRSFARRSPGVFLFGAAAAGFIAGRLVRNHASSPDGFSQAFQSNGHEPDPMYPGAELDLQAANFVEGTDPRGGIG